MKKSQEPVELFSTIHSDVYDVAQYIQFSGISLTYSGKLSPTISYAHRFAMSPRVYPVKDRQQTGEPKQPGSYAFSLIGSYYNMPYMVHTNGLWMPSLSLTIPFPNSSLTLKYNLEESLKSRIDLEAVLQHKYFSFEGTLTTSNLSPLLFTSSIASQFKKLRYGFSISKKLGDEGFSNKFVFDFPIKQTTFGAVVQQDPSNELFIVASSRSTVKNTTFGIELQAFPRLFRSELLFGYERAFTMSRIYTSATMSGTVSTLIIRQLDLSNAVTLSVSADIPSQKYEVGLGLNMQSD